MGQVLMFKPSIQAAQLSQTMSLLTNAFVEGVDLGPRAPHIQAGGDVLAQQILELRETITKIANDPLTSEFISLELKKSLDKWLVNIEAIAQTARSFLPQET